MGEPTLRQTVNVFSSNSRYSPSPNGEPTRPQRHTHESKGSSWMNSARPLMSASPVQVTACDPSASDIWSVSQRP